MAETSQIGPGLPGGFPLPNKAAPGTAYGLQQKAHPAAAAGLGGVNAMSAGGRPPTVGGKK